MPQSLTPPDGTRPDSNQPATAVIMGNGRFVEPKTLEVSVHSFATRTFTADKIFINVGTHAAIPSIPGLAEAMPLTHIEALELDICPRI
jgi:pyruvate/2-oxoglutarate dehydrogenase complex dihydrolipoamide dehydrogenase (E3) component